MFEIDIRRAAPEDHEAVVDLALRAWGPVFSAVNAVLGPELAALLHGPDWRVHQAREVGDALTSESALVWVAESRDGLLGFVGARIVDPRRRIGEVSILGVDPRAQHQGIGAALTEHAESWLRSQGMQVAFIGTGGDVGHHAARRLYERLGYHPFPTVQYFKVLEQDQ